MRTNSKQRKLVALPVKVHEIPEGVILKRGSTELLITGTGATEAVKILLAAANNGGASINEIRRLFGRSSALHAAALIKNLRRRRLLIPKDEKAPRPVKRQEHHFDIFFWDLGDDPKRAVERLKRVRLVIIGVNWISRQLVSSLRACGHTDFTIIDHPRHRSLDMYNEDGKLKPGIWPNTLGKPQAWEIRRQNDLGSCLIVTSDCGGQQNLCEWNKLCLDQKVHFLPVLLKDMIGYVGPMIVPGETACYECLVSRQYSHELNGNAIDRTILAALDGQGVIGFHPSMATVLGDIASFEFTRFYSPSFPAKVPGRLLEINLLNGSMVGRTVLKVPRCPACTPLQKTSETNLAKILFTERASGL